MYFLSTELVVCLTGIKRYGYTYNEKRDSCKKLELIREPNNAYDENAVVIKLDGEKIGYIKRQDASMLTHILRSLNNYKVTKWTVHKHTSGYMIVQVLVVSV